jgi:aspartate aminotransferase-like enzyme
MRTPYWDWTLRINPVHLYEFFGGTPPTQHLYGLRKAVDMMLEEGLDNIFARRAALAGAYWAAANLCTIISRGLAQLVVANPFRLCEAYMIRCGSERPRRSERSCWP